MVAPLNTHNARNRRVVCMAVRVDPNARLRDGSLAARPSTMVPWADPYIAGLVRRLQSEVRFERAGAADAALKGRNASHGFATSPKADLDPPSPAGDSEWEGWDQPRWNDGFGE